MANGNNLIPDGFQVINQGINSGIAPNTLSHQQLAWAINVTNREGFPKTRPGWTKRLLQFLDSTGAVDTTLRDNFEDNLFQGAVASERRNSIVTSIGGRLFKIRLDNFNVVDVSISGDLNRSDLRRAYLVEAEDFVIVQDGQEAALLFSGASSRRSDHAGVGGTKEVPTGTVMSYNQGRLWVALPDGRSFAAGDIIYGPSGTAPFGRRDAVIKFTENTFLNGGGAFAVPINSGVIRAMAPVAQLDTSQGQGPLQVFTDQAAFSVNAPIDRSEWQNLEFPIQSISVVNSGATSDWCVPNVNGDIWYRSNDGIRSFQVARRNFGTWANTPQSRGIIRLISKDADSGLNFASGGVFDNRLYITGAPQLDWDHGTYNLALAVVDFDNVSDIGISDSPPSWEGIWTGLKILQIISGTFEGIQRLFALTLGDNNDIELWEMTKDAKFDNNGTADVKIECSIETKSFNWEGGWDLKELHHSEVWYDELADSVSFTASYRPDQEPCWQSLASWTSCALNESCLTEDSATGCATANPSDLQTQYRNEVRIPIPPDTCDTITEKRFRQGFEFQAKLEWTGFARIKKFRMWTAKISDPVLKSCATATGETCASKVCACDDSLESYSL